MASARLTRTLGTPTNRKKLTASMWLKKSFDGSEKHFFGMGASGGYLDFRFASTGELELYHYNSGYQFRLTTTRKFRDINAWYHLVFAIDTTLGTANDRFKVYVNGVQETVFTNRTNPSQNYDLGANASGNTISVGNYGTNTGNSFDGQMAHFNFIDGLQLTPTSFGQTDATTGIWKPKTAPSVTYGTNGFFLKFDNAANMGLDSGGGSNNMTTSGTIIQNKDTPSNVYATLNPLDYSPNPATLQNCNTSYNKSSTGSGHNASMTGTLGVMTGKWYYEFKPTNTSAFVVGMMRTNHGLPNGEGYYGADAGSYGIRADGKMVAGSESSVSGYSYSANDIFGMAYDFNNGKFYVHVNGTYLTSGDPTSGSTGTGSLGNIALGSNIYVPFVSNANYDQTNLMHFNFGNGFFGTTAISSAGSNGNGSLFEYDVPTGYYALNTKNIGTQS